MGWRDEIHSSVVSLMKILLPLAALGILSTLFLLSDSFDPAESLPVASIDLQQRAEDQGATNATFAGVTRTGDEVLVLTERSKPLANDPSVFVAEDVSAEYRLASGAGIDITSSHAQMNQARNTASLTGDVLVKTSTGYTVRTDTLNTQFDDLYVESPGPVAGQAPAGDITAGRMVLDHNETTGSSHLLFTGGVKLIYEPEPQED
jgi:lipopolysaccharide export system protein LptC